jgi:ABC-type multidrug transport system fused ATPase/permease subunit
MILGIILTIQNKDLLGLSKELNGIDLSKKNLTFYIIPILLGAVYYALGLRNIFFKKPIQIIQKNIRNRLVSKFHNCRDISPYSDKLKENRNIIEIFYKFVDTNPSLKEKSNNVRFNGALLSSFADACVISIFACILYIILFISLHGYYYLFLLFISALVFVSSYYFFLPKTTEKHLDYSDSQIDFILTNLYDELREALVRLIKTDYAK